ncbi:GMP/IMP nucleotidase [Alteromonas sp. D210916BOD_24]|uniref:GMP/IMP nucleotidase n=1 Tax=Alteromonas sp. D210916BOD_24 TaxID=3157618 RepID=UPI00399C53AB
MPFLPWNEIDTVLLDMDGTLLDLHYDNQFWLHHLPKRLAELRGISEAQSQAEMTARYDAVFGQIQWYCLDYWAESLEMDLENEFMPLKRELAHLLELRDDTIPFLKALHESGREVVLVTNAHPNSLALKLEHTKLDMHIDNLISTHEFGVTKESQLLWQRLQERLKFDVSRTLFVDDSLPILNAAKTFGIKHLLAVDNPDSKLPHRNITEFPAVTDYRLMIEDIITSPARSS